MPSPVVVHVIGSTALMVVLYTVMLFTAFVSGYVVNTSERNVLVAAAESISLQLKYAINSRTNTNVSLDYPLWSSSNRPYNIIIGNGSSIKARYSFLNHLEDGTIYVVTLSIDMRVYGVSEVCNGSFNGYHVVVSGGLALFGSTRLVTLNQYVIGNKIILDFVVVGEKSP